MNKETLVSELEKINVFLSEEQLKQIDEFCLFLLAENKKYNLTAIREYEEVLLKHVYDSLTLAWVVELDSKSSLSLLDIGSGAGFPGIILQIVYPNLKVTLLDSNGKKTKFLELVKEKLGLKNLTVINSRAEEYIEEKRESFDLVTARAVANLNILMEFAVPFVKLEGNFIAMKANVENEISLAIDTSLFLKCHIISIMELTLPIENSQRTMVIVEKKEKTPEKYPRRYDQIIKKPLKKLEK